VTTLQPLVEIGLCCVLLPGGDAGNLKSTTVTKLSLLEHFMAKSDDGGCGFLMGIGLLWLLLTGGFAAVGEAINGIIWMSVLAVAVWVVMKVISAMRSPIKTVTFSSTLLGDKKKTIAYKDSGKEVEQITGSNWLGQKTKKTYITKPGSPGGRVRYQTCHSCGASVASTDGSYQCGCGKQWGRR
jgi:hypothetical protein